MWVLQKANQLFVDKSINQNYWPKEQTCNPFGENSQSKSQEAQIVKE